ncbi:alpha-galactosidase [Butyrivibrio sp. ob235]|uniref:alpha-galactosidase n=1 Tax=Butyrivibrio sp. ob235 TaxID=1761780 RepID=UPI0008B953B5|nr:alpha-galactosidase [Butyrivibrio sp. ob235]SEM40831.1 alpha-galactosidase [Butyrivibrio sp. ob235]
MILRNGNIFLLQTKGSSYFMQVLPSGHIEHIHYGASLISDMQYEKFMKNESAEEGLLSDMAKVLEIKHKNEGGNMVVYSKESYPLCLEVMPLEMSGFGKGDIREPLVELTFADGSSTCDFLFESAEISDELGSLETLPSSYDDLGKGAESAGEEDKAAPWEKDHAQQLTITLKDTGYDIRLKMIYKVYPECDTITRSAVLINDGDARVKVDRLLSIQIDFQQSGYQLTSFHGRWADEMGQTVSVCNAGKVVSEELAAGESGSRSNPFTMVSMPDTTETAGDCYGFNLVYSGNHYSSLSSNGTFLSRFVSGIQPTGFEWLLEAGEKFEAPEAVMTYSGRGFGGMSRSMHDFVRKHIVRGVWRDKERPILINNWEATYFNFNQNSLLKIAKEASKAGIELFVLDDGWFGKRNDDHAGLGDWIVNTKKLPDGLGGLAEKINAMGMKFGLWVEPEMVNEDSDLFRAHPEWAVRIPGRSHSVGRTQMILDLTRTDVQDYIIDALSKVFSSANISYIKWDMNRIFSDRFSLELPAERMKEFQHRYYIGLYRIMGTLTKKFPEILFEGCSAGGNRFDLGILSFFPQIWASDDTDAECRMDIQRGYSYGYPANTQGAHVSAVPNHQTLHTVPLETRFSVAAFGCFGYELNLGELSEQQRKQVADQVEFYKKWRKVFQFGDFYRLDKYRFMVVSKDKSAAVALIFQKESRPNNDYLALKTMGLDEDAVYEVANRQVSVNIKAFGSLINTMAPIHVKQDGIIHGIIARHYKMNGEKDEAVATGSMLNSCGVRLNPDYGGTGYGEDTRMFRTGDARLYVFARVE